MHAETGLVFPHYQSFAFDIQPLDDFWHSHKLHHSLPSTILEYDLGAEGDLFDAPKPVIEEPMVALHPMIAAISMISTAEDVDIELMQNEQLLSEVFCEFKKDLLANEATGTSLSEVLQIQIPVETVEIPTTEEKVLSQINIPKSASSECLNSTGWIHGNSVRDNYLDFPGMDFGAIYGMRRSYSEGDIKTPGNGKVSIIQSPIGQPQIWGKFSSEIRKEKLSRYRTKKAKRNFGRKIKYACRKALADSQPRVRGRFAKTDESEISKK
ncbi:uncharacterized protein LOC141721590 [Apium graveolens]|uniref:uncharacterized protein LOC141721590 n=1 Tax=Apium graveolens TaxID=4045 RepID=UPI003D79FCAB